jgi:pilus assembly protein Flp/PilA
MRRHILAKLRHFLGNENGATSIEYALIASGVAAAIIATVSAMGTTLQGMYQSVSDALN